MNSSLSLFILISLYLYQHLINYSRMDHWRVSLLPRKPKEWAYWSRRVRWSFFACGFFLPEAMHQQFLVSQGNLLHLQRHSLAPSPRYLRQYLKPERILLLLRMPSLPEAFPVFLKLLFSFFHLSLTMPEICREVHLGCSACSFSQLALQKLRQSVFTIFLVFLITSLGEEESTGLLLSSFCEFRLKSESDSFLTPLGAGKILVMGMGSLDDILALPAQILASSCSISFLFMICSEEEMSSRVRTLFFSQIFWRQVLAVEFRASHSLMILETISASRILGY